MTSRRKRLSRICIAILTVLLLAECIPFYGTERTAFAADDKKTDVEEQEIPVDAITAYEPEAEADKVVSGTEILDEEGNAVDVDSIPADIPELAGRKSKKKLSGVDDFAEIDPETAVDITVGNRECTISEGGATLTYKFEPSSSGTYLFYSEGSLDTVGQVSLWNADAGSPELIKNSDDDGAGNNYSISFNAVAGKTYYLQVKLYNNDTGTFNIVLKKDEYSASLSVSLTKSTGIAAVKGRVTGDQFDSLYVDGSYVSSFSGSKSLNMKDYSVGLHTIYATLKNHPDVKVYYSKAVPTYIYSKSSNKLSYFKVGHNYFIYSYGGSSYSKDYNCGLMLEYRKKGSKKWKKGYGPYSTSTSVKMTKMKSGKKYQVRTYFAKAFTYGGKKYLIKGADTGKISKAVTFKTGGKKLKVKSVKIKKARQFSTTSSYTLWIYIGNYGYPRTITNTYWYTEFEITVKLKKKPGAKGIYIGNKPVKGNKKTYKTTMTLEGKRKGKKERFELCSYQSTTYKGYSPSVFKKVKVKK